LAVSQGQADAAVATMEAGLEANLQTTLQALIPSASVLDANVVVDRATLGGPRSSDPYQPPVRFSLSARIDQSLVSLGLATAALPLDDAKVRAAFDIGAIAALSYNLSAPAGWNVTYQLAFPAWAQATQAEGGALAPDGGSATWAIANWRGEDPMRTPASLTVRSRAAPSAAPTDAHITLDVDMRDVSGLTLPGLLSGDFGKLDVRFQAELVARNVRLADMPVLEEQVRQRLPRALSLPTLNADGLRLAAREGLLPPATLDRVAAHFQAIAAERLASFGPDNGSLQGGFASDTFSSTYISSPLDGDPPLTYQAGASIRIPLSQPSGGGLQAAGPSLFQKSLTFDLPRVQGLDTVYRIKLPAGIALVSVEGQGAATERGSVGGRDVLVVTPQSEAAQATFTVAVTSEFVLAQFWYVWLGLILLIALLVVFLLIRRARKRRARRTPGETGTLPPPPERSEPAPPGDAKARG
jgi:hypothetical protein